MTATVPSHTLNNGARLPAVGLGCWMGTADGARAETEMMTSLALKHGYRHFDTATAYSTEQAVGKAIRDSGIPRSEIFVTTKLSPMAVDSEPSNIRAAFERSLKQLDIGYIDLYLMHWPQVIYADGTIPQPDAYPTIIDKWKEMEKLLSTGLVKAIGVSNFSIAALERLLPHASVVPAVNQVELHIALPQPALLEYCKEKGIHLTAYCPLGQYNSPLLKDKTVHKIAEKHDADPGRVLLSWGVQRGTSVVPKSSRETRIKGNIQVIQLSDEEMKILDGWHASSDGHFGSLCPYDLPGLPKNTIVGWSRKQMGWDYPVIGVEE